MLKCGMDRCHEKASGIFEIAMEEDEAAMDVAPLCVSHEMQLDAGYLLTEVEEVPFWAVFAQERRDFEREVKLLLEPGHPERSPDVVL